MRKTSSAMKKAALVVLLVWGGTTRGDAQGTERVLAAQDYESVNSTDWVYTGSQIRSNNGNSYYTPSLRSGDQIFGTYAYNNGSGETKKPGTFVKRIASESLLGQMGTGFIDQGLSQKGYIVECDFQIYGGSSSEFNNEMVICTGDEPQADTYYQGNDYIFALSLDHHLDGYVTKTWHINDLTNANTDCEIEREWLHLKLVVTEGKCDYSINEDETTLYSGSKTLDGLPSITCIFHLAYDSYSYLYFDNFKVYDYVEGVLPTEPVITFKTDNMTSKVYTISFTEGDALHYQLPGQSEQEVTSTSEDVTAADGKCSIVLTATQPGTLSAYTTRGISKSQTVTETVELSVPISLTPDKYGLKSFSSAYDVRVPDDVVIYIAAFNSNNTKVELTRVNGTHVIPKETGVMLYYSKARDVGDESQRPTISLDYVNVSGADMSFYNGNKLQGTSGGTYTVQEANEIYCYHKNLNRFDRVAKDVVIGSNKAYLRVNSTTSAANLSIVFTDDDATGITPVVGEKGRSGDTEPLYNLSGQRVDATYKGMVIRNGKKHFNR